MNSINFYQGAKILAVGLGTSFVTNIAGNKLAKYFNVDKKAYTNTIIKTVSFVAGAAAAAFTARHLNVISFSLKNFSFQSKAQNAAVIAPVVSAPVVTSEQSTNDVVKEVSSYYSAEAHDSPDFLEQMKEENAFVDQLAAQFTNKKNS